MLQDSYFKITEKRKTMSKTDKKNGKNTTDARKNGQTKYEDDRTPLVKKIDVICKFLAIFLAIACMADLHITVRGGGYDYETPATICGYTITNLETDQMEPQIKQKSAVLLSADTEYKEGEVIFYSADGKKGAGIIKKISSDDKVIVQGENESTKESVSMDEIAGRIVASSHVLYSFFAKYLSSLGVAFSIFICFILIFIPDAMMFKKRRAAAKAKREAYLKKQERMLKNKKGKEDISEIDPALAVKQKRQAKIDKEKAEIDVEMKKIKEQMEQEEKELKLGGK